MRSCESNFSQIQVELASRSLNPAQSCIGEETLEDILGQDGEPFAFLEESARSPTTPSSPTRRRSTRSRRLGAAVSPAPLRRAAARARLLLFGRRRPRAASLRSVSGLGSRPAKNHLQHPWRRAGQPVKPAGWPLASKPSAQPPWSRPMSLMLERWSRPRRDLRCSGFAAVSWLETESTRPLHVLCRSVPDPHGRGCMPCDAEQIGRTTHHPCIAGWH